MQKILAIIRKDLVLRFTSPSEWLFFLILPIIFTFLLAGGTPSGDEDNRIRLVVVDQARTALSAEMIANLSSSTSVRPDPLPLQEAQSEFDGRRVSALLVIPASFTQEALIGGEASLELRQQPNNLNALVIERAIQVAMGRTGSAVQIALESLRAASAIAPFLSADAQDAYFERSLQLARASLADTPDRLRVTQAQVENSDPIEYDPAANSSAGQLITWVFIPLLGISALFTYERQEGTLRRLLITPTSRGVYLLGTILGQVLTALVQVGLLIVFGIWILHLNWGRDLPGLVVLVVTFTLAAAALGTALGTVVKTGSQANGLSIMLGMVMALMGGCWYPLELFPGFVRSLVRILPTTWAMQGMLDLVLRGGGLTQVLPESGVLLGFAGVFFIVGIWRFKFE